MPVGEFVLVFRFGQAGLPLPMDEVLRLAKEVGSRSFVIMRVGCSCMRRNAEPEMASQ